MLSIEERPGSDWYFALHISTGLTIALLVMLRLVWRAYRHPPALPAHLSGWKARIAGANHRLIYAALVLLPLTGYLGTSFGGGPVSIFGLLLPAFITKNESLKELLFSAHGVIAWALVALVAFHIAAAAKHWSIDRDGVSKRMWFSRRSG
jgi:cytochrome b561